MARETEPDAEPDAEPDETEYDALPRMDEVYWLMVEEAIRRRQETLTYQTRTQREEPEQFRDYDAEP